MEEFAKSYLNWYQGLSKGARALLCILWDIPSTLYRFSTSALKNNALGICLAIILGVFGGWVLFVVDLCCILFTDKLLWLDDYTPTKEAKPVEEEAEKREEAPAEEAKDGEVE